MDIDIKSLESGNVFQKFCTDLLLNLFSDIKPVDGSGGDDGIDSFVGKLGEEIHVFQYKFYTDRLNKVGSRKREIISSLEQAKKKNKEMKKWTLLIALDFTKPEQEWFKKEVVDKNPSLEIDWWGKSKIESELVKFEELLGRYFSQSLVSCTRKIEKALPLLTEPPIKKIFSIADMLKKIKKSNPRLGLEYNISSSEGKTEIQIKPTAPIEFNLKLKIKAEKLKNYSDFTKYLNELHEKGESLVLNEDEIESVDFLSEDFDGLVPSTGLRIIIPPTYLEKEITVSLEIPNSSFRLEDIIFKPASIEGDLLKIESQNKQFKLIVEINKNSKESKFRIKYNLSDKPIYEIVYFYNFMDCVKNADILIFRDKSTGKVIMNGKINDLDDFPDDTFWKRVIRDLYDIELRAGVNFQVPQEITNDTLSDIITVKNLLVTGKHLQQIKSMKMVVNSTFAKQVLEYFTTNHKIDNMQSKSQIVKKTILDVDILMGDLVFKFPDLKITNVKEIEDGLKQEINNINLCLSVINENDFVEIIKL